MFVIRHQASLQRSKLGNINISSYLHLGVFVSGMRLALFLTGGVREGLPSEVTIKLGPRMQERATQRPGETLQSKEAVRKKRTPGKEGWCVPGMAGILIQESKLVVTREQWRGGWGK